MKKLLLITIGTLSYMTLLFPMDSSSTSKNGIETTNDGKVTLSKRRSKESEQWLNNKIHLLQTYAKEIKEKNIFDKDDLLELLSERPGAIYTRSYPSKIDILIDEAIKILYPTEKIKPYTLNQESKNFPKSSAIKTLEEIDMAFDTLEKAVKDPKNEKNKQILIELRSKTNQKIELLQKISKIIKDSFVTSYKERFGATILIEALKILDISIQKVAKFLNVDVSKDIKEDSEEWVHINN